MSPIEEIREIFKMAEDLKKVDQAVLDWYEEHPGETRRLRLTLDIDYDALDLEPETSPYDAEQRAISDQREEIYNAADARGEPFSNEEWEEIRRLDEEIERLLPLAEETRLEIRARNDRVRGEAYNVVWARALEQLQQIDEIEIVEMQFPEAHLIPTVTALASSLVRIAAIPEITHIELVFRLYPTVDISRTVIGANVVQDQMDIKGTGVRVAVIDSGIHGDDDGDPPEHPSMVGTPTAARRQDFSGSGTPFDSYDHGIAVADVRNL